MKNLLEIESFKSFQITKQGMSQIAGSRSKEFKRVRDTCIKEIDQGGTIKQKAKERYERQGKCD